MEQSIRNNVIGLLKKKTKSSKLSSFENFQAFLFNPYVVVPLSWLIAGSASAISEHMAVSHYLFFLCITLSALYGKSNYLYATTLFVTFFYGYQVTSHFTQNGIVEYQWITIGVSAAAYGILLHIFLIALGVIKPKEQATGEEETPIEETKNSMVKIKDVVFLKTVINIMKEQSLDINDITSTNANRLREQIGHSGEILSNASDLSDFFEEVDKNVGIIKKMSEKAIESSMLGQSMAEETEKEIKTVLKTMLTTTDLIRDLAESTNRISEIIHGIENIADQTNLLALNATIESARAGEQGHSFAVVAEEIGKLADTTARSTRNVIDMIDSIRISTNVAIDMVPKETEQARNIIDYSEKVHTQLQNVLTGVEYMTDKIHELAILSRKQVSHSSEVKRYVDSITRFIMDNSEGVQNIFRYTDALDEQTTHLANITDRFAFEERIEDPTKKFINMAEEFLAECEMTASLAIQEGKITLENFFDRKYIPIAGYTPPKYHSSFDHFTDEYFEPIQEKFLAKDARIEYFVLVDDLGYCPTHNKKFSRSITADKAFNLRYSRSKRIYDDPIGIQAAKNTEKYFLQMYRKDTGEYLNDLSLPFFFKNRHWGAVRIGFTY